MEKGKTIKQIADEIGVSKQAVRNEIAKQKLQSSLQKSENQIFVNNAVEIQIKSAFLERQSAKLSEKYLQFTSANKSDEVYELRSKVKTLELELRLTNKSVQEKTGIYKEEIDRLCVELKEKDEHINALIKQIGEVNKLTLQAQQLHGADKALELKEAQEPKLLEEQKPKKRGLFFWR